MVTELEILLIVPSSWILYFNLHQIAVIVETLSRSYFSKTLPTECWTCAWKKSGIDNNKRWISKCGFWNKYFSRPLPVNKRTSISHHSCRCVFKGSRPWYKCLDNVVRMRLENIHIIIRWDHLLAVPSLQPTHYRRLENLHVLFIHCQQQPVVVCRNMAAICRGGNLNASCASRGNCAGTRHSAAAAVEGGGEE